MFRRQLTAAVGAFVALTVLCGVLYPLAITGASAIVFDHKADGSLIERDGQIVGSELLGRTWEGPGYFQPRYSAAGKGYDASQSSASNIGPSNPDLLEAVEKRVERYRKQNGLPADGPVPVDAVTSSGSGLDPGISPRNAELQAERVARERGIPPAQVQQLIDDATESPALGFLGEESVNTTILNDALDAATAKP